MDKQEQLRTATREFISQVADKKSFDASADLKEMIGLAKEIRYDRVHAETEI